MADLDRVEVATAVMSALRDALAGGEPPDAEGVPETDTALAAIVCRAPGVVAGLPVAAEALSRLGARLRPLVGEGTAVEEGMRVAEVGGALRAILAARGTVLSFLERLSAVATGSRPPEVGDPLDAYAEGLRPVSAPIPVGENGPRFELEVLEVQV